jgi:hypothetical protein
LKAKGILEACARQYAFWVIKRIEEMQGWTYIIA